MYVCMYVCMYDAGLIGTARASVCVCERVHMLLYVYVCRDVCACGCGE